MTTDDHPQQPGPQPPAGNAPPRPGGDGFFDSIRRLGVTRSENRWVGGVAGGVAERFGLDPLLVRGLLILSFFITGAGIVVYAIGWALLPERDGRIHVQQAIRGDFDVALLGATVALIVGFTWGDGFWSWGDGQFFDWVAGILWVAVWVAIAWLVVKLIRERKQRDGSPAEPFVGPTATSGPTATASAGPFTEQSTEQRTEPFTPAPPAPYVSAPANSWTPAPAAAAPPLPVPPLPAPPVAPARPPRAPRRGPGAGTVGIVLGLILLAGAVLVGADRVGDLGMPLTSTWLGASIVILGLAVVVTGLRGRRGGTLTFLAILALIAGVITWPFADGRDSWDLWDDTPQAEGSAAVISEGTFAPRSVGEAEDGVRMRFGSAVVDLTELDLSGVTPGDPVVVPISMTAGSTHVEIPVDEAVQADIDVIAGNATWRVDGQDSSVNTYTDGPARFTTDEVRDGDGARLLLDVDVRAGDLTIEESR